MWLSLITLIRLHDVNGGGDWMMMMMALARLVVESKPDWLAVGDKARKAPAAFRSQLASNRSNRSNVSAVQLSFVLTFCPSWHLSIPPSEASSLRSRPALRYCASPSCRLKAQSLPTVASRKLLGTSPLLLRPLPRSSRRQHLATCLQYPSQKITTTSSSSAAGLVPWG